MNKTEAVMYFEFYREDGSWIGAAPAGQVYGEFAKAASIQFEGRIELITYDEDGNLVD